MSKDAVETHFGRKNAILMTMMNGQWVSYRLKGIRRKPLYYIHVYKTLKGQNKSYSSTPENPLKRVPYVWLKSLNVWSLRCHLFPLKCPAPPFANLKK